MKKVTSNSSNLSNKESLLILPLKPTNISLLGGLSSTVQSLKSSNLGIKSINNNHNLTQNNNYSINSQKSSSINLFLNEEIVNLGKNYSQKNIILSKKFIKLNKPNSDEEIKKFLFNLHEYINYYNSCCNEFNYNIFELDIKLSTREEDYNKGGITKDYFIISLIRMQNELISLICKYNNKLILEG